MEEKGGRKEGEKVVVRGHIPAEGPREKEYGRGEGVKAERQGVLCKSKKEGDDKGQVEEKEAAVERVSY